MKIGQSLTELKNIVIDKIISDSDLVKSLIIQSEDFLNTTPTSEETIILENPQLLIRQQIMPYKNKTSKTNTELPYITSAWVNFRKINMTYKHGIVYFYILVPNKLEKTCEGIRYDYIADKLDEILSKSNIGEFEFKERSDIPVDDNYLGHYISFEIIDFYGV